MSETRGTLAALSEDLTGIVSRVARGVVAVHARDRIPSSGILWRPGVVLAANHTVRRDAKITITLPDGSTSTGTIAGRDPGTDLVALRLEDDRGSLADSAAPHGDATEWDTGSLALVVGRPGREAVATLGLVHATGNAWRTWRGGSIDRLIHLDIAVHDGFSGGAVVNGGGEIVGLATSGLARGSALAIPASTLDRVLERLL